jgi:asparagine synthase (glutamine-hydrolysing)
VYRYIAMLWDPSNRQAELAAHAWTDRVRVSATQWSRVMESPGVALFHAGRGIGPDDACLLPREAGAVLGTLFSRGSDGEASTRATTFDEPEAARIVSGGGKRLLEKFWGRYVAVVRAKETAAVWVIRDPSGSLPCWYTEHDGIAVICSDIEDCRDLGFLAFTVNWDYITGHVAHATLQVRDTALNEVSEIQPGERLCFRAGAVTRGMVWNPIEIARTAPLESPEEATTLLRAATLDCVHAWAACYDAIVHNLSGGLDSSIVLSCLRSAPSRPRLTCLNYFGRGPNEDERRYARLMAQHVSVDLVEQEGDPTSVRLEELHHIRHSPRPWFYLYELQHSHFEASLAAKHGASALFTGAGGDSVFYQARGDLALSDFVLDHGLGRGLLATAVDAARVSRQSIWPLLWQAVRQRVWPPKWDPIAMAKPFQRTIVTPAVVEAAKRNRRLSHPWLTPENTVGVPPGTLWHIMSLSMPPAYYGSFRWSADLERILPLLGQPLVELCLRIPTYHLIDGGHDRALARRAFQSDLPRQIVGRYAKGRADQSLRNILDANLPFVRELLLDGLLVRNGLLDRANLEVYLSRDHSPADFQYNEILYEHVSTEAWLRKWIGNT